MGKDNLKIIEVIDTYYPTIDGPINVVTNYCKHLNELGSCKVIAPRAAKRTGYTDCQPFEVIRCRSGVAPEKYRNGMPNFDRKFKRRLRAEQLDIIHTHSPFGMGAFAVKYAKKRGVPVVATLHTKYYEDFIRVLHGFKPLCKLMLRRIMRVYNRADSVWTVSKAACEVLKDYGYKGKIEVVRNGTDLVMPTNAVELVERINAAHGLYGQDNVFIFVGRVAMYKNLELMANALKLVKEQVEFKMLIVGGGFDELRFRSIVDELGLNDNFIFVGAISDRELLQGYYLRSDLFLFPSTFDTSSLVPIEAAAHNLPVLLIEGCSTAENITDNVNGFLAKETADDYAQRILQIVSDKALLRQVGLEAARSVYRSWQTVAGEVMSKYESVIEEYKKQNRN